jgi:hypothetical protein
MNITINVYIELNKYTNLEYNRKYIENVVVKDISVK